MKRNCGHQTGTHAASRQPLCIKASLHQGLSASRPLCIKAASLHQGLSAPRQPLCIKVSLHQGLSAALLRRDVWGAVILTGNRTFDHTPCRQRRKSPCSSCASTTRAPAPNAWSEISGRWVEQDSEVVCHSKQLHKRLVLAQNGFSGFLPWKFRKMGYVSRHVCVSVGTWTGEVEVEMERLLERME